MSYKSVVRDSRNHDDWLRDLTIRVNGILQGRTNNYGEVTLTANSTTTTVTLPKGKISIYSVINFDARTANAGAVTGMWISATDPDNNTFTITHPNNAQTDRTFKYSITG